MNPDSGSTRTVEVIRVGTIGLDKDYPGKQVVRLRDLSELYEGASLQGIKAVKAVIAKYKRKVRKTYQAPRDVGLIDRMMMDALKNPGANATVKNLAKMQKAAELVETTVVYYDPTKLAYAIPALQRAVEDLYARLRGKRLAGINVDVWDQISGAYLGPRNTDRHGTLILPTDETFVEVLQWKLAGGGYSDCFNGERAAGMPGLAFYFHCNEDAGSTIKSFLGVSGQQASLPDRWDWYDSGFFARPALRVPQDAEPLQLVGTDPIGRRSFQFLWYCADPGQPRPLFTYSGDAFNLHITDSGVLEGTLFGQVSAQGSTALQAGTWYLIQINTEMVGGWNPTGGPPPYEGAYEYYVTMQVYLGGILELNAVPDEPLSPSLGSGIPGAGNLVSFTGMPDDGFDEIRLLNRELYSSEIVNYATFLKAGRVPGKSQGALGTPGW